MNLKTHNFSFDGSFPKSKYCDVKLSTLDGAAGRGRVVAAHKVVLAAVSAKLEKLVDRAGEGVGPVTVRNVRFEVLEKIVEFIYFGGVQVEDADVEDFQDGLDTLRIKVNEQEDQNETLRSINVPVSEFRNVPPQLFLPTPTTYKDDHVKVPNNLADSNNPRTVSNSSEDVPNNNNKEDVQDISNLQDGFASLHQQISFDSCDAQPRSRLSSLSSSDSNSENVPHNSTPHMNIPETLSFSSPALSNISVAVRKLQKYRSQAECEAGDSDRESVTSSIMKAVKPCYAISEVSSAESMTEPEKDDPPPLDINMINIASRNSIIKYNVSNPRLSLIRCPFCELQLGFKTLLEHCNVKHPKIVGSSEKVVCNVCHRIVPSYSYELHQQVYHTEKVRLGRDDLGMAGSSSRIMEKDNLMRFNEDFKNSEKDETNNCSMGVDIVTEKSKNLKRNLDPEKVENYKKLKSLLFEDVSEEGVESNEMKVRCLMCDDGKLHLKKNIRRHFALHLPPVKCLICEKEFNGGQMKKHIKLCRSKNAQVYPRESQKEQD